MHDANHAASITSQRERGMQITSKEKNKMADRDGLNAEQISKLKKELLFSPMKSTFSFTRDEVMSLLAQPAAVEPANVPKGWKLVPVEPSGVMNKAGMRWLTGFQHMRSGDKQNALDEAFKAMLDAAPSPAVADPAPTRFDQNYVHSVPEHCDRITWRGRYYGLAPDGLTAAEPDRKAIDAQGAESFQARVQPWMMECFGAEISADRMERNHRFFEEATELVQACGMTRSEAHQLVDYTFGRPIGEPKQESGGVSVTHAALCLANGIDMHEAAEVELARIWTKVDAIRAKQEAKPKHSPLPEASPPPAATLGKAERSMPLPVPSQIDYTCPNKEWVSIGFNSVEECKQFIKSAQYGFPVSAQQPAATLGKADIEKAVSAAMSKVEGEQFGGYAWLLKFSEVLLAQQPAASDVRDVLERAAKVVELYDDATMQGDYMLDAGECAGIIRALKAAPAVHADEGVK